MLEAMPASEPLIARFGVAIATEVAAISTQLRAVVTKLARTGAVALVGAELPSILTKLGAISADAMFVTLLALIRTRECEGRGTEDERRDDCFECHGCSWTDTFDSAVCEPPATSRIRASTRVGLRNPPAKSAGRLRETQAESAHGSGVNDSNMIFASLSGTIFVGPCGSTISKHN